MAAALFLLTLTGTALADTKLEKGFVEFDDLYVLDFGHPLNPCNFVLSYHTYGEYKYTLTLDQNGYWGYRQTDGQVRWEYYYTPDRIVRGHVQEPEGWQDIVADGSSWITYYHGTDILIIVPGDGPVYGGAGIWELTITVIGVDEDGNWIFDEQVNKNAGLEVIRIAEGWEAFCNYLKP